MNNNNCNHVPFVNFMQISKQFSFFEAKSRLNSIKTKYCRTCMQ